jgi:hypothetical protein
MALLQTGCTLAPSILGVARLLVKNGDSATPKPVWQMEPEIPSKSSPALPDLSAPDPHKTIAAAR